MSHSLVDEARGWDFGMVDDDYIAFPVCEAREQTWHSGKLKDEVSYWHERNWAAWRSLSFINYFRVQSFRSLAPNKIATKGVTEGSETTVAWPAIFCTRNGIVDRIRDRRVSIKRSSDGHVYTTPVIPAEFLILVEQHQEVYVGQVIASVVHSVAQAELQCPTNLSSRDIDHLLTSRERTLRFTGLKLLRLRGEPAFCELATDLEKDSEEDAYVRLEAASYLASVCGRSARELFSGYLASADDQTQLETLITLGESRTLEAAELLSEILDDTHRPYFMRSAAAWCLSRAGGEFATDRLVRAFSDIDFNIRDEALDGIVAMGGPAVPMLLGGLRDLDSNIAAGCAEVLRRSGLSQKILSDLVENIKEDHNQANVWPVWLLGQIPRAQVAELALNLQDSAPELHYAITLLWSFAENWIARKWEFVPDANLPQGFQ